MKTNNMQKIYKGIMLVILTAAITFIITSTIMYKEYGNKTTKYFVSDSTSTTFKLFKNYIDQKYIGEIDEEKMLESAIKGYVEGLGDPYSEYITKEEMKEFMTDTVGNYVGVGVYIAATSDTNEIVVLMPVKGGPAEKVGIKTGDIITKIDGVAYPGEKLSEASNMLKKESGTKVQVEIKRNGEILNFEITRENVKLNHIETDILNNKIGYMQISTFDEGCYEEFKTKWEELSSKNITSLIVDLRNNGGGIVDEALNIANMFAKKGEKLLITRSKDGSEQVAKSEQDKIINIPVVILINENTASSSEILAAAIKENNENAKLVGKTTYGKGVIQTIYTLSDGSGLKLTTNEYYTPNHNAINKIGIKPDIEVEFPEEENLYLVERQKDTQLQKAIETLNQM